MDSYPAGKQRPQLLRLLEALDGRSKLLCRDLCGDWAIMGKWGHIYAIPLDNAATAEGFQIVFGMDMSGGEGIRRFTTAKARLPACCRLAQDGEDGGTFLLDRLPTQAESAVIRSVLGLKKRYVAPTSEAALANRAAFAEQARGLAAARAREIPLPPSTSLRTYHSP